MSESGRQLILVITEDRSFDDPAVRALSRAGYALARAGSIEEGVRILDTAEPAAAIVDVQAGRTPDAIGIYRRLREESAGQEIPILFLAPAEAAAQCLRALEEVANDCIVKPALPEELAFRLALHLRDREQRLALARMRAHAERLETAIRERTATLERQIRFTGQIIDSLPVSLYVVDRHRTIVAWNRQREMGSQGMLREKALGKSLFEVFDHQKKEAIEAELAPVFGRGETLLFERDSTVEGEVRHYRIRKLPMRLEPGEVTHVLTIGEDITEQRRMEKSMVVTEKMAAMGRLAAGVAHEINNPLATIVTCAEGLEARLAELPRGEDVSSEFREYLQIVEQEAYRAKRITEDLLDFSRVRPSQRRIQSLEKIVDRTLLILKHHDGFKRIEVERVFQEDLPQIAVEEDAIVQALVALIINALDAMPEGGRLRLTTSSEGDEVRCEVSDSGGGILPSDLPQIFEPFFTTKPPGRGTGLGLAVCYGIVKSHGGRIEVESKFGEGSRFTVVVPAACAGADSTEENLECSLQSPSGS